MKHNMKDQQRLSWGKLAKKLIDLKKYLNHTTYRCRFWKKIEHLNQSLVIRLITKILQKITWPNSLIDEIYETFK